jgi:hypothetical protein
MRRLCRCVSRSWRHFLCLWIYFRCRSYALHWKYLIERDSFDLFLSSKLAWIQLSHNIKAVLAFRKIRIAKKCRDFSKTFETFSFITFFLKKKSFFVHEAKWIFDTFNLRRILFAEKENFAWKIFLYNSYFVENGRNFCLEKSIYVICYVS